MSLQSEAVKRKVKHIGAVRCDICEGMRADCVQFRTGWFSSVTICDTCAALVLREFDYARVLGIPYDPPKRR